MCMGWGGKEGAGLGFQNFVHLLSVREKPYMVIHFIASLASIWHILFENHFFASKLNFQPHIIK